MTEPYAPDLVGAQEIARRLGVRSGTVRQWVYRAELPPPDLIADGYGRKLWLWETVEGAVRQLAARAARNPMPPSA